jgi:hypothetical protein
MLSFNQHENSSIMAEETYDSIKHMFNSYEYMVDGDFCTINKCETDDELVESVKCMKEISFCHSQHSTMMLEFSCWLTDNIYKKSNGIWIIIEILVYV